VSIAGIRKTELEAAFDLCIFINFYKLIVYLIHIIAQNAKKEEA